MTADNRDHSKETGPMSAPADLRTGFIRRTGIATGWRTGAAALIGAGLLVLAVLYFGSAT